jgi:hypothetical protein
LEKTLPLLPVISQSGFDQVLGYRSLLDITHKIGDGVIHLFKALAEGFVSALLMTLQDALLHHFDNLLCLAMKLLSPKRLSLKGIEDFARQDGPRQRQVVFGTGA